MKAFVYSFVMGLLPMLYATSALAQESSLPKRAKANPPQVINQPVSPKQPRTLAESIKHIIDNPNPEYLKPTNTLFIEGCFTPHKKRTKFIEGLLEQDRQSNKKRHLTPLPQRSKTRTSKVQP